MKNIMIATTLVLLSLVACNKKERHTNNCPFPEQRERPNSDSSRMLVPNAFTPNGDGINDWLRPMTTNITAIEFTVFDENNIVVFRTTKVDEWWKPTIMEDVVKYTYQVKATTTGGDTLAWCGTIYSLKCIPNYLNFDNLIFGDQFNPAHDELLFSGENYRACE